MQDANWYLKNEPARWSRDQLETLFSTLSDQEKDIVGEKKDELMCLSTLFGTPGHLTFEIAFDRGPCPKYAYMYNLEWDKGIKALYNPQLELPEECPAETREVG